MAANDCNCGCYDYVADELHAAAWPKRAGYALYMEKLAAKSATLARQTAPVRRKLSEIDRPLTALDLRIRGIGYGR